MAFTMTGLPPIRMHYPSLATQECRPDTPANSTINRNIASHTPKLLSNRIRGVPPTASKTEFISKRISLYTRCGKTHKKNGVRR